MWIRAAEVATVDRLLVAYDDLQAMDACSK